MSTPASAPLPSPVPSRCHTRVLPVRGLLPEGSLFIYRNAGTMNQRTVGERFYTAFSAYNSEVVSDDVIVVGHLGARKFLLVGALTARRSLTRRIARVMAHTRRHGAAPYRDVRR
ncbi:MAG: hypothetical protein IKO40_10850 [Kiritimatiellae bacterium]|nr:hypothetical protein [Kiritimatiellia bacterium]